MEFYLNETIIKGTSVSYELGSLSNTTKEYLYEVINKAKWDNFVLFVLFYAFICYFFLKKLANDKLTFMDYAIFGSSTIILIFHAIKSF